MKIIYNNIIPFKGFCAMNLFGVIFARKSCKPLSQRTINHETIHTEQMKEMLFIFFYLWYLIEWIIKLFKYWNFHKAYRNISFEREAYSYQYDCDYTKNRRRYAWTRYL